METGSAKSWCFGLLLYRWRLCLLLIVCFALLLSLLLVSGSTESGVSVSFRPLDSWFYLFLVHSGASFGGMILSNNTNSRPSILQISALDKAFQLRREVAKEEEELTNAGEDFGARDINTVNMTAMLLPGRSGTEDDNPARLGEEAPQLEKSLPLSESSPIVTDIKFDPLTIRKTGTSHHDDVKPLHQYAASARKKTALWSYHPDQCDVSVGSWVYDDSYPLYQPSSCPYIEDGFDCQKNGRPDSAYMRWRWKPKNCQIPRFNASNFLERLRGKRTVFVGDSLNRNQWESMLCLLREALPNKSRMFETHGQRITKEKGAFVFQFLDYNCQVEFHRSHYLVAQARQPTPGSSKLRPTVRLDAIDTTATKWRDADIIVFTTGHWWDHGKTARGKNFFQEGDTVYRSLPMMVAFRKAMTTWGSWIDQNVNPNATKVFFCGYSPAHFRGGQWNSAGQCYEEIEPISNKSYIQGYPEKMVVLEETMRQMKTPVTLLNVTRLSQFRKDAHPSIYSQGPDGGKRTRYPQDCSHWCLPGLPDIWNELLYAFLIMQD